MYASCTGVTWYSITKIWPDKFSLQILQNPEIHPKIRQIDDVLRELGLSQLDIDQPENFSIDQQGVHEAFCDV